MSSFIVKRFVSFRLSARDRSAESEGSVAAFFFLLTVEQLNLHELKKILEVPQTYFFFFFFFFFGLWSQSADKLTIHSLPCSWIL